MTDAEKAEHEKLLVGWAARKLSKGKMLRCMALTRKAEQDAFTEALAARVAEADAMVAEADAMVAEADAMVAEADAMVRQTVI